MDTRIAAAADHGAVVVALAALERLGRRGRGWPRSSTPPSFLPQAGQGTLAIECRADDATTRALLAAIDHEPSHRTLPRRAGLPGSAPAATATSRRAPSPRSRVTGWGCAGTIPSLDGHVVLRHAESGTDPEATGRAVARFLLDDAGGSAILLP